MGFKLFGKRGAANEKGKGAKLITLAEPQHVISEQFRHLRSHIEYAGAVLPKLQVVMVTSAECRMARQLVQLIWRSVGPALGNVCYTLMRIYGVLRHTIRLIY